MDQSNVAIARFLNARGVVQKNRKREQLAHIKVFRFLQAGADLFFEQLRDEGNSGVFGWKAITEKRVLDRARLGKGTFKYRWPDMRMYHKDLAIYISRSERWREVFEWVRKFLIKGLDDVLLGTRELPDLILQAAERDVRLRMRLAHWEVTQSQLAIDATYAGEARAASRDFHAMHINAMVSVYTVFLERLNLQLKPGRSLRDFAVVLSDNARGAALGAIKTGEESHVALFKHATLNYIADYIAPVVDRSGTASRSSYDVVMEWGAEARRGAGRKHLIV